MYFAVLASMIHGLTIPGAIEVAQRAKGYNNGLFEWLRKAPWGNPVFSGVFISIIGFGFLGGITGVMMGTEQLNMIIHNTIYVPGHFHATVVVGTTLSFMALTYFLIPVLFRREMINPGLAKIQPYFFGLSMYFFCLVMMGAGTLGVSRRHGTWHSTVQHLRMNGLEPRTPDGTRGHCRRLCNYWRSMYIYITVGSILWARSLMVERQCYFHAHSSYCSIWLRTVVALLDSPLQVHLYWRWSFWCPSFCTTSLTGSTSPKSGV
jgi:cytochrome c oxidase subunit 1